MNAFISNLNKQHYFRSVTISWAANIIPQFCLKQNKIRQFSTNLSNTNHISCIRRKQNDRSFQNTNI